MKTLLRLAALALLFVSVTAMAANFDGDYTFKSRVKDGKADLVGWTGTMKITNNTMTRNLTSADGKDTKFYEGTLTLNGDVYTIKYTKAYKPEYVGNEHKNKITINGNTLTMEDVNGKFKEVWTKK